MVINISVQYSGGLLPDIILLTQGYYQCVCVFVCFLPIHSGHQVRWTSSRWHTGARSHRIFHPPSFCGASAIPFFPSSTVKSNFVY